MDVLVNGVFRVFHTCHFKSGSNISGLCMPCDTSSMVCWEISAEANNPSYTFCMMVDHLLNGHVNRVTKYVTLAHLIGLTLSPPFLRISSALGWATGRFRRDVVHRKVPGIVGMIHHKVKRTNFLQG